ncbi:hypothetical protein L1987_60495 [Smallanthus sonchifolius]|uniref:Uncharacterized protein n=1 Tax=Smallanthus sonchifolius TaxID=185202 RepID=A0ACB9D880_9ASTR|nr:hypothetical protein L1987_60495 [Smallanthus sonchifolius]
MIPLAKNSGHHSDLSVCFQDQNNKAGRLGPRPRLRQHSNHPSHQAPVPVHSLGFLISNHCTTPTRLPRFTAAVAASRPAIYHTGDHRFFLDQHEPFNSSKKLEYLFEDSSILIFCSEQIMASVAHLHHSPLAGNNRNLNPVRHIPILRLPTLTGKNLVNFTGLSLRSNPINPNLLSNRQPISCAAAGGSGGGNAGVGHGSGGGGGDDGDSDRSSAGKFDDSFGPFGAFLCGWRSRVSADPQFPFKVLMEEVVGVSATVFGDMATRPNFGLHELDFVFSTLVVGSILNFTLMYLLAPTMTSGSSTLPFVFANSPTSHMFEPGAYTLVNRLGTFVYKGALFAAVGLAAGLVGTALSNGLIKIRKKMDPGFVSPNKAPPTVLNAATWAIHMGLSANLRYQSLNGIEFVLAKGLPPLLFKSSVVGLRLVNNVVGGMTFVVLARMTGSQSAGGDQEKIGDESVSVSDDEKKLLRDEVHSK